jgi:hypothetical protein
MANRMPLSVSLFGGAVNFDFREQAGVSRAKRSEADQVPNNSC